MTPTSSVQLLGPRRPRHRAGASGCPAVWSFVAVRVPFAPPAEPAVLRDPVSSPAEALDDPGEPAPAEAFADSDEPRPASRSRLGFPIRPWQNQGRTETRVRPGKPGWTRSPSWDRQGRPRDGSKGEGLSMV